MCGFQNYHKIDDLLEFTPSDLRDIVLELRNLVAAVAPNAKKVIHACTNSLSYFFSENRGGPVSAGICGISLKDDHVQLFFPHGAFNPAPQVLLTGTGKAMCHLVLWSYESVPWEAVRELIREHAAFDVRSMRYT